MSPANKSRQQDWLWRELAPLLQAAEPVAGKGQPGHAPGALDMQQHPPLAVLSFGFGCFRGHLRVVLARSAEPEAADCGDVRHLAPDVMVRKMGEPALLQLCRTVHLLPSILLCWC